MLLSILKQLLLNVFFFFKLLFFLRFFDDYENSIYLRKHIFGHICQHIDLTVTF